jgi:hypothetical protein
MLPGNVWVVDERLCARHRRPAADIVHDDAGCGTLGR